MSEEEQVKPFIQVHANHVGKDSIACVGSTRSNARPGCYKTKPIPDFCSHNLKSPFPLCKDCINKYGRQRSARTRAKRKRAAAKKAREDAPESLIRRPEANQPQSLPGIDFPLDAPAPPQGTDKVHSNHVGKKAIPCMGSILHREDGRHGCHKTKPVSEFYPYHLRYAAPLCKQCLCEYGSQRLAKVADKEKLENVKNAIVGGPLDDMQKEIQRLNDRIQVMEAGSLPPEPDNPAPVVIHFRDTKKRAFYLFDNCAVDDTILLGISSRNSDNDVEIHLDSDKAIVLASLLNGWQHGTLGATETTSGQAINIDGVECETCGDHVLRTNNDGMCRNCKPQDI